MEINQLKAMVAITQDFYNKLEERHEELVCEWKRTDSWICGIIELTKNQKQFFEVKIKSLEEELESLRQELAGSRLSAVSHVSSLSIGCDRHIEEHVDEVCDQSYGYRCESQTDWNVHVSES